LEVECKIKLAPFQDPEFCAKKTIDGIQQQKWRYHRRHSTAEVALPSTAFDSRSGATIDGIQQQKWRYHRTNSQRKACRHIPHF